MSCELRVVTLSNSNNFFVILTKNQPNMNRLYSTSAPLRRRVRDYVVNGMTTDGLFRVALIDNTQIVNHAQQRFQYYIKNQQTTAQAISLYGKTLSSSALLSSFLKGEERIHVEAAGSGLLSQISAESIQVGETRGFMSFDENSTTSKDSILLNAEKSPGIFSVQKILYDNAKPSISSVILQHGTISDELFDFFKSSEQVPTAVHIDTVMYMNDERKIQCLFSYGMIVQALPVKDEDIAKQQQDMLADLQEHFKSFSKRFKNLENTREKLHEQLFVPDLGSGSAVLFDYPNLPPLKVETIRYKPIDFMCRCSMKGILEGFASLGTETVAEMQQDAKEKNEPTSAVCTYCNEKYIINDQEYENIYHMIKEKQNN